MAKIKRAFTVEELKDCMDALQSELAETQQTVLRDLCPCRSRCYDQDVWLEICGAMDHPEYEVRHQAEHAIETLMQRAMSNQESRELRDWLDERGALGAFDERKKSAQNDDAPKRRPEDRVRSSELPRMIDVLDGKNAVEKQRALKKLCPCRNVQYNIEVWKRVVRLAQNDPNGHVRDQAFHAIDTLKERARKDPRSQELIKQLIEAGAETPDLCEAVPVWDPLGRGGLNGLYIPRYEPPSRSRKNRARR